MNSLRSPLGRVLGSGSAHAGAAHWWRQRVSAVALVPLGLWLLFSLLLLPDLQYATVRAWLSAPVSALLALLLVAMLAVHAELGVSVVIEDYVHTPATRIASLLALRFALVLVAGSAVIAVLRIAFAVPVT